MQTFTPAQLRHQPGDIDERGLRIVNATNLPADRCFRSDAVIIGPTAIDLSISANYNYSLDHSLAARTARAAESKRIISAKRAARREWLTSADRSITGPQVPRAHVIAAHVKPSRQ